MEQDNRSPILKSFGVRTWRGAAVLGLQALAIFLPVLVAIKIVGGILGIASITDQSWWWVLLSAIAPAVGLFVAVALIAEIQSLANK